MVLQHKSKKGSCDMAIEWTEPKTNWSSTDRFNISDFNRIKNNLKWLHNKSIELYRDFAIEDMGEDITSYESYWNVNYFNAFEENVNKINSEIYSQNFGISQNFFENGPFIKWEELNRIENACLQMKDILERQELGLQKLSFRLGSMKGVKV